jgi:hypothetical protein
MEILLEENNDLKAEIFKIKALDNDEKTKAITDEN